MPDKIVLSDEHRKLLLNIAAAVGISAELTANKYEIRSPVYARGYLEGLLASASNDIILLDYLALSMINDSIERL